MIDKKEIDKLMVLSKLDAKQEDLPRYASEFTGILNAFEHLKNSNLDGVEPLYSVADFLLKEKSLRDDVVSLNVEKNTLLSLASKTEEGLYLVPKVIESEK